MNTVQIKSSFKTQKIPLIIDKLAIMKELLNYVK
jgi:hypothetical protein